MPSPGMDFEQAVDVIRKSITFQPEYGLVLGSGLGGLADMIENPVIIPYGEIPGWPQSTVQGHSGRLVMGLLEGKQVLVQQGRAHFYEGYSTQEITFPIRVMFLLGIHTIILTNAAGGLNPNYKAGDLMLLSDHINFVGMSGNNPLMGPNDERFGPRFPGMAHPYDQSLRSIAREVSRNTAIDLHEGVYVCLSGPGFETPAEVRMLRAIGGDAVGMSTANEVLIARHAGMRVMAISSITNEAIEDESDPGETNHEEVLEVGQIIVPRLTSLLKGILKAL